MLYTGGNVFKLDKIITPVNIGDHNWSLVVAYVQKREIKYYDSMEGDPDARDDAAVHELMDAKGEASWRRILVASTDPASTALGGGDAAEEEEEEENDDMEEE